CRAARRSGSPEYRTARNRPRRLSCCRGAGRQVLPWRQGKLCSCGETVNHEMHGSKKLCDSGRSESSSVAASLCEAQGEAAICSRAAHRAAATEEADDRLPRPKSSADCSFAFL